MTSDHLPSTSGFPSGYFTIRNLGVNGRLVDVYEDLVEDGTEIILYPEQESSLVESFRNPHHDNQVFFIDTSGALCSKSSGHALDIDDGRLVLRHRRPIIHPFPNKHSHPLPRFAYSEETKEITVTFETDPSYPTTPSADAAWSRKKYVLTSLPQRRPRDFGDDASKFISNALHTPLSFLKGSHRKATPEDVQGSGIELDEDEVLEEERGEEAEVDDSPDPIRRIRVMTMTEERYAMVEKAKNRRRWEVTPLRKTNARRL